MSQSVSRAELRCKGKIHGIRKDYPNGESYIEIRCKDNFCTDREPGVVVFHYFDVETGVLHHTKKFSSPPITKTPVERDSSDETRKVNQ